MSNVFQTPPSALNNPTYGADTKNLGFQLPGGTNPWSGSQVTDPKYNFGGASNQNSFAPQNGGLSQFGGINGLIQKQLGSNAQARQQNQQNWTGASGYLKQFATPFDPNTISLMKTQNQMAAQGAENNAFREQQGIMAASGQGDASSLAAAAAEANRHAMGAQVGANSNLDIQARLGNNKAGYDVGNSILSNLPQYKPDDYSGLGMLGLMGSNQAFQQNLLQNQMDRPISPGMTNSRPALGNGQQSLSNGGQGGGIVGGYGQPNAMGGGQGGYASYNPNGVPQGNQWGNGQPNGNSMTNAFKQGAFGPNGGGGYADSLSAMSGENYGGGYTPPRQAGRAWQ